MIYYSTNGQAPCADLRKAVVKGLAEDKGLYMPERIPPLSAAFFEDLAKHSFVENSLQVARAFFGEDVPAEALEQIVTEALAFDCPVKEIEPGIWSLELFHGPTLAFKDVGARFMAMAPAARIRSLSVSKLGINCFRKGSATTSFIARPTSPIFPE